MIEFTQEDADARDSFADADSLLQPSHAGDFCDGVRSKAREDDAAAAYAVAGECDRITTPGVTTLSVCE